ncbi:MAG TPA: hypothetical protein VGM10_03410 [Actinocrinis sp.]|jgi:hypothetical protein
MPKAINLPPNWPPLKELDDWDAADLPDAPADWQFEIRISWWQWLRRSLGFVVTLIIAIVLTCMAVAGGGLLYYRPSSRPLRSTCSWTPAARRSRGAALLVWQVKESTFEAFATGPDPVRIRSDVDSREGVRHVRLLQLGDLVVGEV